MAHSIFKPNRSNFLFPLFDQIIKIKYNQDKMTDRRFINHQYLDSGGGRLKVQCRFCTHKQQYNKFQHVAPCGCIGNTRYVHRHCLQNWFTVKFQHVYNQAYQGDPLDFNVFCQICQQKMEIQFSMTKKCLKYDQFLQKLEEDKLTLVVLILLALGSIGSLVFILIFASISYVNANLLAIIVSICLIVFVADLVFFCWRFLIIKSVDIENIPNHKEPPKLLALPQEDIHNIEQIESYRDDPHFGQAISRNLADKTLMLQSKRDSGSQKRSSLESKTLTDIVMRQMYQHDLLNQRQRSSNGHLTSENYSQREEKARLKNKNKSEKDMKKSTYQKEYAQQAVQVSAFKETKQSSNQARIKEFKKKELDKSKREKSVEMSRQQKSFQRDKQKSKNQNIVERSVYQIPQTKYKKSIKNQQGRQKDLVSSDNEKQLEQKGYNIIKQKNLPSEEEFRPTVKKIDIQRQKQSVSVSQSSNRVKLKNLKDPIKIKIRF